MNELYLRNESTIGSPLRTSAVLRARTAGIRVAVLLSAVVAVAAAHADTYTVNSMIDAVDETPGDGVCATAFAKCTLRAAVQEANAHAGPDVITLPAGSYPLSLIGVIQEDEDDGATGDLDVSGELEINGAGAETTIIDGLNQSRVLEVDFAVPAAFAIRDVTIRGGLAPKFLPPDMLDFLGGGMAVHGRVACTVERVTFRDNYSYYGGGGLSSGADLLTITGSTFDGNRSTSTSIGGSALRVLAGGGGVTIADSTFTGNTVYDLGSIFFGSGAASIDNAALNVTNTTFTNNAGGLRGGGLNVQSMASVLPTTLSGCTFDGNAAQQAGALFVESSGPVSITNTTMTNNTASQFAGGGVIGSSVAVTISGGDVSDNVVGDGAGGLYINEPPNFAGTVTIDGTTFRRNQGDIVGGLLATAKTLLSLTNVEASENTSGPAQSVVEASTNGGGISLNTGAGDIVLTKVRVLNNHSFVTPGGGLFATATGGITLVDSTIFANVSGDVGGGVHLTASGALSIQGTTIAQNRAVGGGGLVASGTTFTITNSTISGNVAEGVAGGGGLSAAGAGTIRNVTFVDNDAPTASAILNAGTLTVVSAIIAGNAANHCGGAAVTSGGNNLDSNGSCAFAAPGDQNNVDPQLGPLADNGGPTLTHMPADVVGSPVVDHGAAADCPATDQRGETRPKDADGDGTSVCDIGAVEVFDLCPNDPTKREPGICGCGVADTDAAMANGTPDCFVNGELKARIARARAIIGSMSGDQDPTEAELNEIGGSLKPYLTQFHGQVVLNGVEKKIVRLARKAAKAIAKVTKVKAGKKLDRAKKKATEALDRLDAAIAPQA
jgi:CSLREA domain-containing protein